MDYKIIVCLEVCGVLKKTFSYRVQTIIIIVTSKIVFVFFDCRISSTKYFCLERKSKEIRVSIKEFRIHLYTTKRRHSFVCIDCMRQACSLVAMCFVYYV